MTEAEKLEFEIMEKAQKLAALRQQDGGVEVSDYAFQTLAGATSLSGLFAGRERLLMIHNMGQGCRLHALGGRHQRRLGASGRCHGCCAGLKRPAGRAAPHGGGP